MARTRRADSRSGDPNSRGLGILRCTICNKPYRDHELTSPCPELDEPLLPPISLAKQRGRWHPKTEEESKHRKAEQKAAKRILTRLRATDPPDPGEPA